MTTHNAALSWLRIALANPAIDFRDGQWEAIDQLVNQRGRVLCVQRTGWGKSMVYFVSAKLMREQGAGPTLIISPLLALMRNQIEAANRLKLRAETINSTNSDDWQAVRQRLLNDVRFDFTPRVSIASMTCRASVVLPTCRGPART